jgi:hypothetical protein
MDAVDVAVNIAWWTALAVLLAARKWRPSSMDNVPEPWVSALVFALGNLVVVLVLSNEVRYGYLWFALGPAAVFAGISRVRGVVGIALALTLGLVVPQLHSLSDAFSSNSSNDYRLAEGACDWLGFDPAARRYYVLPFASADSPVGGSIPSP